MSSPFLSEIKLIAFNFAPQGWAMCNGQFLPINQNQALFSLLGTTYGGNGQTTFALPDLRGRVPMHMGGGHVMGEKAGTEAETISASTMPAHTHAMNGATNTATLDTPSSTAHLASPSTNMYGAPNSLVAMASPQGVGNAGGSQPHSNIQPYLVLNFCIALQGIFPSQT